MPKRRHEGDLDYYLRKIRRIERRMKRRGRHNKHGHDDSNEDVRDPSVIRIPESEDEYFSEVNETSPSLVDIALTSTADKDTTETVPTTSLVEDITVTVPTTGSAGDINETVPTTTNPEVLLALGDLMPDKPKFGPPMNSDVARIWSTILKNGLQKDNKQKIMEQLIPENCPLLLAPKLNPEITSSVSDNIVNRDKKIEAEQNQLGIGLSVLCNAVSLLINSEKVDRLKVISTLSDTGRILADLHFTQTKSRKNLLFPVLDKKFIEAVKDIDRDDYLYGNNLIEKIKVLKTCQRTGQSIKKFTPASTTTNQNRQGNLNGPPRYNPQKPAPRYGHKKVQPSATNQARKPYNPQYHSTVKKPKMTGGKPHART